VEPWNHLLYFIEGVGDLTIGDRTWSVQPGTSAKVKAGGSTVNEPWIAAPHAALSSNAQP
jgi:hypothetical protein